jgi:drug/metabolite transporter (DMT)-like permease
MPRLKPSYWDSTHVQGVTAALLSAVVLGLAPIFGKQAMLANVPWQSVVMLRTVIAVATLWIAYALHKAWRPYFYIYPVGFVGCMLAGLINGLGSLMYYNGLNRLDAALAQLLYTLYPLFLTLYSRLDGHPIPRFTLFRLALAIFAVYLLKWTGTAQADWVGGLLMIGGGAMYALHLAVNQRVLYDVPAPTVTLYTLTAMAVTVAVAYGLSGSPALPATVAGWQPVLLLTAVTILSRLMLFTGVKHLGGLQTALLGLSELLITVLGALLLLGEQLTLTQWLGAALLAGSVLLVSRDKSLGGLPPPKPWLQIFTAWFAALDPSANPSAAETHLPKPPPVPPLAKPAPAPPPSSSKRVD